MRFLSYDRGSALGDLGGLIAGPGLSAVLAWFIFACQSNGKESFWTLPGIIIVTVTGVGIILFMVGFLKKNSRRQISTPDQAIRAGGRTRTGYDIGGRGSVDSYNAKVRNQDIAYKVRGNGRLRDEDADIG